MAPQRTHSKISGAPDYDSPEFWDARFATGSDVGEWLNSGDVLIDAVLSDLNQRPHLHAPSEAPRVLHLGPGVSQLGRKLRDACLEKQWAGNGILNVDFSTEAVRLGQHAEEELDSRHAMHWRCADLLQWDDVATLTPFAPFDVILDKSTSDAIATFSDCEVSATNDSKLCPTVREVVQENDDDTTTLSPVELLALNLIPLTKKDTTWITLSYSTLRFDCLRFLGQYWHLRSRTALKAPSGPVSSSAHTPDVFHWVYVLDRK
ncbi:hypothetical protein PENSTE_c004G04070 [Penicillium steckii]|uniref:Methyltransferase domain-containing protein n=1 Tax=Penicillium steckii TaxID=303698 RepID=A0A1V6TLG2_9EURO|nr:hypothetical protein PENSTE_c004G04070 [Penicillium steckii]